MTTPMNLVLPVPTVTLGPLWASELNTALEVIESHNHAPGSGSSISFTGLGADSDLSFLGNTTYYNATDMRMLRLSDQTALTPGALDLRGVYSKSGELFYVDAVGNEVQITVNGQVKSAAGNITGMTADSVVVFGVDTYSFYTSAGVYSNIRGLTSQLVDQGTANFVTLAAQAGTATYTLKVPTAAPARLAPVTMNPSGVLATSLLNNGQMLIGSTAGSAIPATLTGTANQVTVTNAANSVTLSLPALVNLTTVNLTTLAASGFGSNPAIYGSDPNSGIRFGATNEVDIKINGFDTVRFLSNQVRSVAAGSVSTPIYSFESPSNDTGMWLPSTGTLGFSAAGNLAFQGTNAGLQVKTGSSTVPGLSGIGNTTAGLSWNNAGSLTLLASSATILTVSLAGVGAAPGKQFLGDNVGAGTSPSTPAYGFAASSGTGWYSASGATQSWSISGTETMRLSSLGLLSGNMTPQNGPLRWETYEYGSLANGASSAIITASGTIKGMLGTFRASAGYAGVIAVDNNSIVYFVTTASSSDFQVHNRSGGSLSSYRVTVFY